MQATISSEAVWNDSIVSAENSLLPDPVEREISMKSLLISYEQRILRGLNYAQFSPSNSIYCWRIVYSASLQKHLINQTKFQVDDQKYMCYIRMYNNARPLVISVEFVILTDSGDHDGTFTTRFMKIFFSVAKRKKNIK